MPYFYFEDFHPGKSVALGARTITEAEIIGFARQYDPQIFHLDPEAARRSPFGGLIASGWHSAAIFMRLFVDGVLRQSSALASPGVDDLRWLQPVRPGDRISARVTVLETVPSRSKPDRGLVKLACESTNQRGEIVMTMCSLGLFARRPASGLHDACVPG